MSMAVTPHRLEGSLPVPVVHVALEPGAKAWKVGFTPGLGRSPRTRTLRAGNLAGLECEIERARRRFGLPEDVRVVCSYEAGRDGFWIHRALTARGLENYVADSASIDVNRRKRRRKSDGLDLGILLRMLARYAMGEREVWKVVHVPSPEAEDRRHLHREIWTLTQERTERTNRIKSLLATQGVALDLRGDFPRQLREARFPDGRPLGSELRARLEREWVRRQSVIDEINALEAERRARLRQADGGPALEQVRALMALRGIGLRSAWLFVMEFFERRLARAGKRARRRGITAVARKLLIALWRYLDQGVVPDGAVFKDA